MIHGQNHQRRAFCEGRCTPAPQGDQTCAPAPGHDAAIARIPNERDPGHVQTDGLNVAGLTLEVAGVRYPVDSLAHASHLMFLARKQFEAAKRSGAVGGFIEDAPIRDESDRIVGYVGRGQSVFAERNAGPNAMKLYDAGLAATLMPLRAKIKDGREIVITQKAAPEAFTALLRDVYGPPVALVATATPDEIGCVHFMPGGGPIDSFVRATDRRQGVGTALYDALELVGGIIPPAHAGLAISDDALALRTALEARGGFGSLEDHPLFPTFRHLVLRTDAAEKESDPSSWSDAERLAWDKGDWKEFSRLRGYTPDEIEEFAQYLAVTEKLIGVYGLDDVAYADGVIRGQLAPETDWVILNQCDTP